MQEKSDPYPFLFLFFFFFSSNITSSIIVVTNMAAFQFNYSVICIPKKPTSQKLNFATENYWWGRVHTGQVHPY